MHKFKFLQPEKISTKQMEIWPPNLFTSLCLPAGTDVVVLHMLGRPGRNLPNLSPFVMKLETFLRLERVPLKGLCHKIFFLHFFMIRTHKLNRLKYFWIRFRFRPDIRSQNRNQIRKYFSLFIRGPDRFESWEKIEVENLVTQKLKC